MAKDIVCFLIAAAFIIYLAGWWGVAGVVLFLIYAWSDGYNRKGKTASCGFFFWWKK